MRISDWSSDVCSSDLRVGGLRACLQLTSVLGREQTLGDQQVKQGGQHERRECDQQRCALAREHPQKTAFVIGDQAVEQCLYARAEAMQDRKSTRLNSSH